MANEEGSKNRRLQIRLSKANYDRVMDLSERYGMSANSIVSYTLGQWLDNNYDLKEFTREKMVETMADKMKNAQGNFLNNPEFMKMIEGLIREGLVDEKKLKDFE